MRKILNKLAIMIKNILDEWTICLIKRLSVFNLWLNRYNNPNPNGYEDLTPTNNGDDDRKYSEALEWALKNENIKNIALTGAFGSGKSSILRTFEKEHQGYNYLNISLASFGDTITNEDLDNEQNIDRLIELSILQQIFYHVKHKNIPDSRFKRIKSISKGSLLFDTLEIIVWILALLLFFMPKFIQETAIGKELNLSSPIFTYLLPSIILLGIGFFIAKSIRIANNSKLNKLNIQSGEIEISQNIDSSILNKHLDEILYFFEVTKYNVLIIEDLDRFNNTNIFTKLRELNILINGSEQINRRVVFIYAIKDDMFHDTNRTKFFDFIIPVIPVVNISNSGDKLYQKLTKNTTINNPLSRNLIDDVSMYIDDMRLLINICNEYAVYKEKLTPKLNQDNLLAMIIYKNIFPSDFVDLHNGKGKVFSVFESKPSLIKERIDKINTKIDEINIEIKEIENVCLYNIQELRAIYIEKIIEKIPNALSLRVNDNECSFSDCKNDDNFEYLQEEDKISYYYHHPSYNNLNKTYKQSNLSFENIEADVDSSKSYQKREQLIQGKYNNKVELLKKHIEELKTEKIKIKSWTLQQIAEKIGLGSSFDEIKSEKLIIYLIRNGYINENYHDYISYFYEELITKEDREFRFSILNRESLPFDYKLIKVENLIKKIRINEFEYEEILNCSLLDLLLFKQTTYTTQYQTVLTQICNKSKNSIAFIDCYIEKGLIIDLFITSLCNEWNTFWDFLVLESGYSNGKKDIYLKLIVEYVAIEKVKLLDKNKNISKYLSEKTDFLEIFTDEPHIKEVIKSLNVKFHNLILPKTENHLFDFIYENNLYEINKDMIDLIIKVFTPDNLEKLKTANYTTVKASNCKHLINYIENNLNNYVSNVLLIIPENAHESEESIIHLLYQKEEIISLENRKKIIDKQTASLTNLSTINEMEDSLIEFVVEKSKMMATWNNVFDYYVLKEEIIDSVLVLYLNQEKNYRELTKVKISTENKVAAIKMANAIIINENITDDCFEYLLRCCPYAHSELDFENLSERKVELMIKYGYLSLSVKRFNYIKEHFSMHIDLLKKYSKEFIENQTNYSLDKDDVLALLSSSEFNLQQKISIIQNTDKELIVDNKELSYAICYILSGYQYIELDFNVLKSLIQYGQLENKIKLLNIQFHSLSHDQITELLNRFDEPYSGIATKGKRPSIPKNQISLELVHKLHENDYISSFKEKGDKIKVNTKSA